MSSLQRYRKSGGFYQLLSLIETFGPQKKEKFLEMIDGESAAWSAALREKMITLERVFGWPDQIIVEVFKRLPIKSQAFASLGLKEEQKNKIMQFYSQSEQRRLSDVITESAPKPEEIQATLFKMVEVARRMIQERELSPDKFDPALVIPEDIEAKLEVAYAPAKAAASAVRDQEVMPASESAGNIQPDAQASAEVYQLQRTLAAVLKENKTLKEEIKTLHARLDGIRKLSA